MEKQGGAMSFTRLGSPPDRVAFRLPLFTLPGLALLLACLVPLRAFPQQEKGAGVVLSGDASAKDVGLPLYPGSRRHKDKDKEDDSPAANFGLWGGGSGFKLVVLKMESDDSPEKVAGFYKKALAKYGKVLDCSHPAPLDANSSKSDSKSLTCGDDKPEKGGVLFKAGTKEKQHLAAVQPNGSGSLYQLVYVADWGNSKKQ
jgi:hypothetical protein